MALLRVAWFRQHLVFWGVAVGFMLSVITAIYCPAADMKPGDSRMLMAAVGAIFLVPGCVGTAYAARSAFRTIQRIPRLRYFWMTAFLFFTLAIVVNARVEWTHVRQFIREGRSVDGTVVETHSEDHDTLRVAYTISGVNYYSRTEGARVARSYRIGEPVTVYYFASAPAKGFCVKPRWRPDMIVFSWFLAVGILPLWGIGIVGAVELRIRSTRTNNN